MHSLLCSWVWNVMQGTLLWRHASRRRQIVATRFCVGVHFGGRESVAPEVLSRSYSKPAPCVTVEGSQRQLRFAEHRALRVGSRFLDLLDLLHRVLDACEADAGIFEVLR